MLIEVRVDLDGARVQAGLVREGARPDIRLAAVGRDIGDLTDRVRDAGRFGEPVRFQEFAALLDLQVGDDGHEIGVARSLAIAVDGPLDVRRARVDRRHRVGDRAPGVVVAVDADPRRGCREHIGHDIGNLGGQHPAVGVAQRDHLGARLGRHAHGLQRVCPVGGVAVEKVFGVEEDAPALAAQEGHGVADHLQVLGQGGAQRALDMSDMALGHQRDDRGPGVEQGAHQRVGVRAPAGPAGGAEGRQRGVLEPQLSLRAAEKLRVLGVGPRPPTFDEPHAQVVEVGRNCQLVRHREVQALLLRAVAQGGVVDVQVAHRSLFFAGRMPCGPGVARGLVIDQSPGHGPDECVTWSLSDERAPPPAQGCGPKTLALPVPPLGCDVPDKAKDPPGAGGLRDEKLSSR